jgi:hypothetical protein
LVLELLALAAAVIALKYGLRTLHKIIGVLSHAVFLYLLFAYYELRDEYFVYIVAYRGLALHLWLIAGLSLVVERAATGRIHQRKIVALIAALEFGSRITRSTYPVPTLLCAVAALALFAPEVWTTSARSLRQGSTAPARPRVGWWRGIFRHVPDRKRSHTRLPRPGGRLLPQPTKFPYPRATRPLPEREGYFGDFDDVRRLPGPRLGWEARRTTNGRIYQIPDLTEDEVRKVNPDYRNQRGKENCRHVSVAALRRIFGYAPEQPVLTDFGNLEELEKYLGREFEAYKDIDDIVRIMAEAGNGKAALVAGYKEVVASKETIEEWLKNRENWSQPVPYDSKGHVFVAINEVFRVSPCYAV